MNRPERLAVGGDIYQSDIATIELPEEPIKATPEYQNQPRLESRVGHWILIQPTVELFNIHVTFRKDGGHVHLDSDQWPIISAFGGTFQEAVANFNALIKDLIREYVLVPEEKLAADAIGLRNYLISRLF
jgi:hypothetical protein